MREKLFPVCSHKFHAPTTPRPIFSLLLFLLCFGVQLPAWASCSDELLEELPALPRLSEISLESPIPADPRIIDSAVVGIFNESGQLLMNQRGSEIGRGEWAIVGGKLDPGESLESGARREVLEEIGVRLGELHPVFIHYHRPPDRNVTFRVFIFAARLLPGENPQIQNGEESKILALKWVDVSFFPQPVFGNFYDYADKLVAARRRLGI